MREEAAIVTPPGFALYYASATPSPVQALHIELRPVLALSVVVPDADEGAAPGTDAARQATRLHVALRSDHQPRLRFLRLPLPRDLRCGAPNPNAIASLVCGSLPRIARRLLPAGSCALLGV
eukprot:532291-Rhodomonas_salina.2